MKELIERQNNIKIWNELKQVPAAAKKKIGAGRLKGLTDIKPQWRLQMMTEQFGPIGIGWYYDIVETWTECYDESKEISAYVKVKLYIKDGDNWSMPICGIGGSMLLSQENIKDYEKSIAVKKYGNEFFKPYHSDECYKMALTDALSVAMKQLGVAADVYMGLSDSKYDKPVEQEKKKEVKPYNTIPFEKYAAKAMTVKQKATLRDQKIKLSNIATESSYSAIKAIDDLISYDNVSFDNAASLINKVKLTIEKESK